MHKLVTICIALLSAALLVGCQKSDATKATELIEIGMYAEAVSLLENGIQNDPTNARLHYLYGRASLALLDNGAAQTAFARAIQLDSGVGKDVGQLYFAIAKDELNAGNTAAAEQIFRIATGYDAGIASSVSQLTLEAAKRVLATSRELGLECAALAVDFDESARAGASTLIADTADKLLTTDIEAALRLYATAIGYDGSLAKRVAQTTADAAMKEIDTSVTQSLVLANFAVARDENLKAELAAKIVPIVVTAVNSDDPAKAELWRMRQPRTIREPKKCSWRPHWRGRKSSRPKQAMATRSSRLANSFRTPD